MLIYKLTDEKEYLPHENFNKNIYFADKLAGDYPLNINE